MNNLTVQDDSGAPIDLVNESIYYPLAVAFNTFRSPNYSSAVAAAKQAYKYSEISNGNSVMHMAVFPNDRIQLSTALHLLHYIQGIKSSRVFSGGRLMADVDFYHLKTAISCYLTSLECNDWRAHCHRVVDAAYIENPRTPFMLESNIFGKVEKVSQYLFPCQHLLSVNGSSRPALLQKSHSSTPADQLQALAVKSGCAWCANFRPNDFRKL